MYDKIIEIQQNSIQANVCTIVFTQGSAPRKAGTKMIVYPDGSIFGTIGGGAIEKRVIHDALQLFQSSDETLICKYQLEKDLNMTCGGYAEVFIEKLMTPQKLFIFGAGHIGKVLADFASKLNFSVTLIDERDEMILPLNESNYKILHEKYSESVSKLVFNKNTYIVIVSHQHDIDREIAAQCIKNEHAYVGMIGSKRKFETIKTYYRETALLSEDEINLIDCPIGVDISCKTPEEIAISILAKLIDVRNKK